MSGGGFLGNMVGAAGCDGQGNMLAKGMQKMYREGAVSSSAMPMDEVDMPVEMVDHHGDWGQEFLSGHTDIPPHMQHLRNLHGPPGHQDWAAEMMAGGGEQDWAAQFQQNQEAGGMVEEFLSEEVQTFGVEGEAPQSYEEKLANCRSVNFPEMTRTPATAEDWVTEFEQKQGGEEWADQFMQGEGSWAEYQNEDWYKEFQDMVKNRDFGERFADTGEGWAQEYLEGLGEQYQHDESNPYLYHENPFEEGLELLQAGSLSQAILAFEAAVQKNPEHAEAWRYLGTTQAENENEKAAILALTRARELDPTNPTVLMQLGVSYTNEGHPQLALDTFREWITVHPVHGEFAKKALAVTETAEGIEALGDAEPVPHDFFAELTRNRQRTIQLFEAVVSHAPDPDLHAALGVLYHMDDKYDKAADAYRSLLQHPDRSGNPILWNRLGAITANGGNHVEALKAYNRALDINPGFVRAQYNVGISYNNLNEHQKAAEAFITALRLQNQGGPPKKPPGFGFGAMEVWDALRNAFNGMGRQDLYDLTWKGDISLFNDFSPDPFADVKDWSKE